MVNRARINSAQSIFFGISPVAKQFHSLPSYVTCLGVVSWFSKWYLLISNVSQPIRIKFFLQESMILLNYSCSNSIYLDWLNIYCSVWGYFTTISGEGLQKLGLCSLLTVFKQGGIFIMVNWILYYCLFTKNRIKILIMPQSDGTQNKDVLLHTRRLS